MTREEQIKRAEIKYSDDTLFDGCDYIGQFTKQEAFIAGAKWADEHPQHSKEEFIEKAVRWLEELADGFIIRSKIIGYDCDKRFLVEDFKQRMGK